MHFLLLLSTSIQHHLSSPPNKISAAMLAHKPCPRPNPTLPPPGDPATFQYGERDQSVNQETRLARPRAYLYSRTPLLASVQLLSAIGKRRPINPVYQKGRPYRRAPPFREPKIPCITPVAPPEVPVPALSKATATTWFAAANWTPHHGS